MKFTKLNKNLILITCPVSVLSCFSYSLFFFRLPFHTKRASLSVDYVLISKIERNDKNIYRLKHLLTDVDRRCLIFNNKFTICKLQKKKLI